MKFFFAAFALLLCQTLRAGQEPVRGTLKPPPEMFNQAEMNQVLFSEMNEQHEKLKKVKYYLINGEVRLAQAYLSRLSYTHTKLRPVIFRYQAILAFMQGDFETSYELLSRPILNVQPNYPKICILKVLNQIVLKKISVLENEWGRCKTESSLAINTDKEPWLEILIKMTLRPYPGITRIPFKGIKLSTLEAEDLKVLLKMALYLNQENMIAPQLNELSIDQLQDPEVREIVGQLYFRMGMLVNSYRFIEDLKSPNAENIKGNLYVLRGKYELAYAQFKVALEQKQNSQNAMERLLPLAWLLGDWAQGSLYAERVIASPHTQINKLALATAFMIQKGEFSRAINALENINQRSRKGGHRDVTQLYSFAALMENKPSLVKKQAKLSCEQYDLMNCWLQYQLVQWDSFPLTIRRGDDLPARRSWEKLIKEDIHEPLKETVYVNQLDIEELDDKLIKLVPHGH